MRELTMEELNSSVTGNYKIRIIDGYIYFQRFPSEAIEVFKANPTYHIRAEATSGVRLRFRSDTRELVIAGKVLENSPQTEPFIILCNDSVLGEFPAMGIAGEFEQKLMMTEKGEKTIEICFPAYSKGSLLSLQIEQNSSFLSLKRRGVYLAMGNSITQQGGRYMGYADIVARGLDFDLHDAGVGGHIFDAESIPFAYIEKPSFITLAYGTNDWSGGRAINNSRAFLDRITSLYPLTPIFLLEPIRRYKPVTQDGKKLANNREGISLLDYRKELRRIAKNYPTVKVINYKKLMPDDSSLFIDLVHPTDKGHIVFGNNLLRILKIRL
ncbi:MAG: SGNH/GDSL hydrolase family protein [Bacteroidetes bacterium]|nr:SGNH/GDSL hydrolase family protein [Bacteroidota bacterium]MDA1122476.1 SGNH/GDSL hydrolase family protein [Bacteroidota bacterium]